MNSVLSRSWKLLKVPQYTLTSSSVGSQVSLLDEVEGKVLQVMRPWVKVDPCQLTKTSKFKDLGIDSLDSVHVVVEMEAAFGFDLTNQEAHEILSVDQAINTFFTHLNARIANKLVQTTASTKLKI